MASPTVFIQDRGPESDKNNIAYLSGDSVLAHPNVQLVSSDGVYFKLNAALLASASKTLAVLLKDEKLEVEPFSTVVTEIDKSHLASFCHFVATGQIPQSQFNSEIKSSFLHLGINLEDLSFATVDSSSNQELNFEGRIIPPVSSLPENGVKTEISIEKEMKWSQIPVKVEMEEPLSDEEDDYGVKDEDGDYYDEDLPLTQNILKRENGTNSDDFSSPTKRKKLIIKPLKSESEQDSILPAKKRFSLGTGKQKKPKKAPRGRKLEEGPLKCERCPYSTKEETDLKSHALRHGAQDLANKSPCYSCELCRAEFTNSYSLSDTANKWQFKNVTEFQDHLTREHPNERYIFCPRCGTNVQSEEELTEHDKLHHVHHETLHRIVFIEDGNMFDGWFCSKCRLEGIELRFKTRREWTSHVRDQHLAKTKVAQQEDGKAVYAWGCNKCKKEGVDMVFKTKNEWLIHCKDEHKVEVQGYTKGWKLTKPRKPATKPICPKCGKKTHNLERHDADYHSGGHMCPECGKVVKDGPTLKEHINMNHKIVTCDECGAQLPKHKLAYHKHQLHTRMEDKNYVCDKCSPVKAFFDKFAYNDHMNIHLGMKPHVCKRGCRDVAYANASTLHAHYRTVHDGKKRNTKR